MLWLVMKPERLYRHFGVDVFHLRTILLIKLAMDDRTATGINKVRSSGGKGETKLATAFTMVMAFIMGLTFLFMFFLDDDLSRLTLYLASFGFMLAMFLVTDFSHILLDTKDNYIILPKPVSAETFLTARLLHILIHISKILVPLAFPGFVAMWVSRGILGAFLFIPILILLTVFTFAIVNALYLFIFRLFSLRKIDSIITSIQIGFTALLYGSFQVLPHLLDRTVMESISLSDVWYVWILPSYWFACAWKMLYSFQFDLPLVIGAFLAVLLPVASFWVMVRYLAPSFLSKLSMMTATNRSEDSGKRKIIRAGSSGGVMGLFGRVWTRNNIERQFFFFVGRMVVRNRDFRLKVYPMIGYMLVLVGFMVFKNWDEINFHAADIQTSGLTMPFLWAMYLSGFMCITALYQLPYTEQYNAAWVYFTPPIERPGILLRASLKACIVRFFFPFVVVVSTLGLFAFGVKILPNLLFGFGAVLLGVILYAWMLLDKLPFSFPLKKANEDNFSIRNMFIILFTVIFAVPQYFLFEYDWVLLGISVLLIAGALYALHIMRGVGWNDVKWG